MVPTINGMVGYQRKTLPDLVSSLLDGRLYKELQQITTSNIVKLAFLVIEHTPSLTTTDGRFLDVDMSQKQFRTLLVKVQSLGIHYLPSNNLTDTLTAIVDSASYLSSSNALLLRRPTAPKDGWGNRNSAAYLSYFLQSLPSIGPKLADAIVAHFHTRLPLAWVCEITEFLSVPGIGPKLARQLYDFFDIDNT